MLDSQQKVSSLQELSAQLLVSTAQPPAPLHGSPGGECLEAQEKVHVIWNRLRLLLREVDADLEGLQKRLERQSTQQVETTTTTTTLSSG